MTEIQSQCGLVFAGAAAIQMWVVWTLRRIRERRGRRFPRRWIVWTGSVVTCAAVALWTESFLVTTRAYESLSAIDTLNLWSGMLGHVRWMWQPFCGLCIALLGLAWHPRSYAATAGLVAAAGLLASLMVAAWLFATNHEGLVFRILVLPGGLGLVAAFVGFGAATTLWMAIGRWLWRSPV
jgi:hypothetical protein